MDFPKIAHQVIEKLGGKENINALAHCATRLRIVLKDESRIDKEAIENIDGVKGQFSVAGQYPGHAPWRARAREGADTPCDRCIRQGCAGRKA